MYRFQTLEKVSYEQMAECFRLAFSDYAFPMELSPEQLRGLFQRSGVRLELSCGAFSGEEMVGFLFHSVGPYRGKLAAFDVATGVVPAHRGRQVFSRMFPWMEKRLAQEGVEAYYLEVLQQNQGAVRLYQKQGFAVVREFVVLQSRGEPAQGAPFPGEERDYARFDFSAAAGCTLVEPSFEHSAGVLGKAPHLYRVRYLQREGRVTAFCVYAKENGAVLQLGYEELPALSAVLESVAARFPQVTAKNIDTACPQVLALLKELSFQEVTRQFEMRKDLGPVTGR